MDAPVPSFMQAFPREALALGEAFADSPEALAFEAFSRIALGHPIEWIEELSWLERHGAGRDAMVASMLLENAAAARERSLPLCQDTGVAGAFGWVGRGLRFEPSTLAGSIERGAARAYRERRLRASMLAPVSGSPGDYPEANTRTNLPADLDLRLADFDGAALLFHVKGGGATNKTRLWMLPPSFLQVDGPLRLLERELPAIGAAACPPYRIAMAIGGASPEANLRALKLATLGALETASALEIADASLHPQRCPELEAAAMDLARRSGIGAQLGGEAMALDARIYRLPRHAASVAVSLGVACCARRHAWAFVRGGEAWIERQGEARAARDGLPREPISQEMATPARIDFSEPFGEALSRLRALRAGDEVRVSGPVLVARDAAHARLAREIERGAPDWSKDRPIFYAGPTEAQEGMPSGSFGPTTASRMDEWLEPFMRRGISLVTIAKGNRGAAAADACRRYGGVYLATTGGTAALFARDHVRDSRIVAWDELGMEAVRLVTLDSLPAIVAIDSTGRDFYAEL